MLNDITTWKQQSILKIKMRLLNAKTLQVETIADSKIPAYAILTHTWAEEEVTLSDIVGRDAEGKAGYQKIRKCCAQTVKDQLVYIWIDTCCIDATNSMEVSEAINSMYRWYKTPRFVTLTCRMSPVCQSTRTSNPSFPDLDGSQGAGRCKNYLLLRRYNSTPRSGII